MTRFSSTALTCMALLLSATTDAQSIALQNISVVDVASLKISPEQTVVIRGQTIDSILSRKNPLLPKDVTVLDMTGKFLIPGLIDTHVHHATSPDDADNDQITRTRLRNLLRGGVTTVRDMGGDARALASLQRRANADVIQSPDIYYSAIIGGQTFFSDPRTVASAKGRTPGDVDWMRAADRNSDFDQIALRTLGTGASGIKIYASLSADVIGPLVQSAERHELKAWSHAFVGPAKPMDAIKSGIGTISHAADISAHVVDDYYRFRREDRQLSSDEVARSLEPDRYTGLIAAMKKRGTILDATLTVFEQNQDERGEKGQLLYDWSKMFTQLAHENGIKVSAGTDATSDQAGKPYPMVQHEMQLLVADAGFSPLQAIQSATLVGAEVIGIDDRAGSIAEGKTANLVILNSSPAVDIENATDIAHVIKNGQFVHRGDLPGLPFTSARAAAGLLWMSGQLGNFPSTKTLVGDSIEAQMTQAMKNFNPILQEYDLSYEDIVKCTLFLEDIDDWPAANTVYRKFFVNFPSRSALATGGLALGARVEIECIAEL